MDERENTLKPIRQKVGSRIRYVREDLLGLSRKRFCLRHPNISPATLQNWETGRYGGLTGKGAYTLEEAFKKEGVIHCSTEWLLAGTGKTPTIAYSGISPRSSLKNYPQTVVCLKDEDSNIMEELKIFYMHHPDATHVVIKDDLMLPFYFNGDCVAGNRLFGDKIDEIIDSICIAQTQEGNIIVRMIKKGSHDKTYSLLSINKDLPESNFENIKLISAAPILWCRRKRF